jgi:hypothetical protein
MPTPPTLDMDRAHQGGRAPAGPGGGEPEVGQGHQVHRLLARDDFHHDLHPDHQALVKTVEEEAMRCDAAPLPRPRDAPLLHPHPRHLPTGHA